MLVLRRVLGNQRGVKDEQQENIFHSYCTVEGKVCLLIIDKGSCANVVSLSTLRSWASRLQHIPTHITSNGSIRVKVFKLIPGLWFIINREELSRRVVVRCDPNGCMPYSSGASMDVWIVRWCTMDFWIPILSPEEERKSPWHLRFKKPEAQKSAKGPGARSAGFEAKARAFQTRGALRP